MGRKVALDRWKQMNIIRSSYFFTSACFAFVAAINFLVGRMQSASIFLFGALVVGGICLYVRTRSRK